MYHYHLGSLRTSLSLLLLCRRVVHTCSEELYGILASNGLWRRGAPFNVKREEGTRSPPLLFFPCCVGRKNPRAKASWIWALAEVSSLQWILKSTNYSPTLYAVILVGVSKAFCLHASMSSLYCLRRSFLCFNALRSRSRTTHYSCHTSSFDRGNSFAFFPWLLSAIVCWWARHFFCMNLL